MNYWQKRKSAFAYAFNGLLQFFKEPHARIHLSIFILVLLLGFFFDISKMEWLIILLISALVFGLEMMNSALETLIDHLHPEIHPNIGKVKDLLAAGVLVVAILALVIGGVIFGPYFLFFLK